MFSGQGSQTQQPNVTPLRLHQRRRSFSRAFAGLVLLAVLLNRSESAFARSFAESSTHGGVTEALQSLQLYPTTLYYTMLYHIISYYIMLYCASSPTFRPQAPEAQIQFPIP